MAEVPPVRADPFPLLRSQRVFEHQHHDRGRKIPVPQFRRQIELRQLFAFGDAADDSFRGADSVRLKLKVANEYEAVQLVLGACGNARVYAPERLRDYLRRVAERIVDHLDR